MAAIAQQAEQRMYSEECAHMLLEIIEQKLLDYIVENGRVTRNNFPNDLLGIPPVSTCRRKGLILSHVNALGLRIRYNKDPKLCKQCRDILDYESRMKTFCNSSCSAIFSNTNRVRVKKERGSCPECGTALKRPESKYCTNKCQRDYDYRKYIERWKVGGEHGWISKTRGISGYIRRYLYETYGSACSQCGWDERHPVDGNVLTEIDHIDGDAENNKEDNLRILCPNCHSKTPTFRVRNMASKRNRK